MDAYSNYILRAAHNKQIELWQETAEQAMSRAARQGRPRWHAWLVRRRAPAPARCPACQAPLAITLDELVGSSV